MWQKLLKILLGDATGRIDPLKLLEDSNYITEGGEEPPSTAKRIYIKINTLPSTIRPPWIRIIGLGQALPRIPFPYFVLKNEEHRKTRKVQAHTMLCLRPTRNQPCTKTNGYSPQKELASQPIPPSLTIPASNEPLPVPGCHMPTV